LWKFVSEKHVAVLLQSMNPVASTLRRLRPDPPGNVNTKPSMRLATSKKVAVVFLTVMSNAVPTKLNVAEPETGPDVVPLVVKTTLLAAAGPATKAKVKAAKTTILEFLMRSGPSPSSATEAQLAEY
jgi:hypothetical protein